jgi:hypothetical protein
LDDLSSSPRPFGHPSSPLPQERGRGEWEVEVMLRKINFLDGTVMKSTDNRYRPPRVQYKIDDWSRKKPMPDKERMFSEHNRKFGRKKKQKP